MSDDKDTKFKISDRRKFNPDGTPREQSEETEEAASTTASQSQPSQTDNVISFPGEAAGKREDAGAIPSAASQQGNADNAHQQPTSREAASAPNELFISLLNMLGVEAAMYLGLIESPGEPKIPMDIEAARRMIDLLAVLQEKTAGNLAPQEAAMLEGVLSDLRMQFVAISRKR